MRRLFALILLVLLPLQFSWSAVAPYCERESAVDAHHGGHHVQAFADADDIDDATTCDVDGSHCHGHGTALPSRNAAVPAVVPAVHARALAYPARGAYAAKRPERPQWRRLA